MDFQDFLQYGEMDLRRSESAFSSGDFAMSAYFAQQAVEKFFKAYFLRFEIFDDPKALGHYQIPKMIEELVKNMDGLEIAGNGNYVMEVTKWSCELSQVFARLESNFEIKIIAWKESLGMELTDKEKGMDQGLTKKSREITNALIDKMRSNPLMDSLISLDLDDLERNASEREKAAIIYLRQIQRQQKTVLGKETVTGSPPTASQKTEMNLATCQAMENLLLEFGWGSGEAMLSKKTTRNTFRMTSLLRSFQWAERRP